MDGGAPGLDIDYGNIARDVVEHVSARVRGVDGDALRMPPHWNAHDARGLSHASRRIDGRGPGAVQLDAHQAVDSRGEDVTFVRIVLERDGDWRRIEQARADRLELHPAVHVDGLAGIRVRRGIEHAEQRLHVHIEAEWAVGR